MQDVWIRLRYDKGEVYRMKGILFFLGGLFAVFLIALTVFFWIRRKIRRYSGHLFGAAPSAVLQNIQVQEEKPKSLNGMDTVFCCRF